MSDKRIIELIRKGKDALALKKLYSNYPAVVKLIIESGGSPEDAKDIFQDALSIFVMKVADDNFTLTSSISTYIFGICKNLNHEKMRNTKKRINFEKTLSKEEHEISNTVSKYLEEEEKYKKIDKALEKTGSKCLKLLQLYYYQRFSMKQIAKILGYNNESSAKTQKYKCLEKVRKLVDTTR